jgi:hypothetical protein
MDNREEVIDLSFPKVGDIIQWVNLLEVWSNDNWVDDGGPYFHWSVWDWKESKFYHVSSTTDEIRILSRSWD